MADTIEIIQGTATTVEVAGPTGPQGPAGAAGASQADVLTTAGDLLYRSATAAARLGIGAEQQVLKVSGGLPVWAAEAGGGVTSVTGTAPIVSSGGTTPAISVTVGSAANTVCAGDDARLSDARTPTSHVHGNITNAGLVGTTSGLPLKTGTGGIVEAGAFGTSAGQFAEGNHTHAADAITSGTLDNARINFAAPPAIGNTTPAAGTFTTLSANNGTLTASAPVLDLAQTWNNAAVTFTGARIDITNTASATGSRFLDCIIGGASAIRLARISSAPYALFGTTDTGIGAISTSQASIIANGGVAFVVNSGGGGPIIRSDAPYAWASGTNLVGASSDLTLFRDAADILAQRRGANGQTFRLYNTFTDASNHERLSLRWASNVAIIGTEKAGTGSARNLEFQTDGTTRMGLSTAGVLTLTTTNTLTVTPNATSTMFGGAACIRLEGVRLTLATGGTDRLGISAGGDVSINTSNTFSWLQRGNISWSADGVMLLRDNASTAFGRLQFGGTTSSFPALKRDSTAIHVRLADDSAFAPLSCGALTLNGNLDASTRDLVTDTTTGTKIGTATNQKLGFFNATPVVQQAAVADATDAASTQARLNDLLARVRTLGLIAT